MSGIKNKKRLADGQQKCSGAGCGVAQKIASAPVTLVKRVKDWRMCTAGATQIVRSCILVKGWGMWNHESKPFGIYSCILCCLGAPLHL